MSELRPILNANDPRAVANAIRDASELLGIDRVRAVITAGTEAANVRTITVQCVDRRGQAKAGRFVLLAIIETASYGGPAGAQTVGTPSVGTILHTLTANQSLVLVTGADGRVVFDLTVVGAATRYILVDVLGEASQSAALTWS